MSPPDGTIVEPPATPPPAAPPATPPTPPATPPAPPPATPPATPAANPWGDDWRQRMANGDEKALSHLGRYTSPEAVYDALRNAQSKIDSGVVKEKLPENATPEQITEWRKANGVPEAHDKYDIALPNGAVLGEADKPAVDSFLKHAHGLNWSNDQVKQGLAWWHGQQEEVVRAREESDVTFHDQSLAALAQQHGGEYRRNETAVNGYFKGLPPDVQQALGGARTADGKLLLDHPAVFNHLLAESLFRNPIPSAIGGTSEAQVKAAETELSEIRDLMKDRTSKYWKGPESGKLQARFRELTDGLNQIKTRKAS